jgi:hypothetical protein
MTEQTPNYRFYRGCKKFNEAWALADGYHHNSISFWTDSLDKAAMYGNYVTVLELDELPPHFNKRQSVALGNKIHGNIREWRIPRDYYEKDKGLYCYTENSTVLIKGLDF